jgi:hypothetical protein
MVQSRPSRTAPRIDIRVVGKEQIDGGRPTILGGGHQRRFRLEPKVYVGARINEHFCDCRRFQTGSQEKSASVLRELIGISVIEQQQPDDVIKPLLCRNTQCREIPF